MLFTLRNSKITFTRYNNLCAFHGTVEKKAKYICWCSNSNNLQFAKETSHSNKFSSPFFLFILFIHRLATKTMVAKLVSTIFESINIILSKRHKYWISNQFDFIKLWDFFSYQLLICFDKSVVVFWNHFVWNHLFPKEGKA